MNCAVDIVRNPPALPRVQWDGDAHSVFLVYPSLKFIQPLLQIFSSGYYGVWYSKTHHRQNLLFTILTRPTMPGIKADYCVIRTGGALWPTMHTSASARRYIFNWVLSISKGGQFIRCQITNTLRHTTSRWFGWPRISAFYANLFRRNIDNVYSGVVVLY